LFLEPVSVTADAATETFLGRSGYNAQMKKFQTFLVLVAIVAKAFLNHFHFAHNHEIRKKYKILPEKHLLISES